MNRYVNSFRELVLILLEPLNYQGPSRADRDGGEEAGKFRHLEVEHEKITTRVTADLIRG